MIKALFLIFKPAAAWERILQTQRSLGSLVAFYLLPMMLLVAAVEGFGLVEWGKPQAFVHRIHAFSIDKAIVFEALRLLGMLVIVVVCAILIKIFGETFRGRHTYQQTFTLVIYGLSPLFLLRLLDAAPVISPWVTWAAGIMLCTEVLYQGVPRVMEPDPPNAFGLYFMSSLVLVATTGLERFVTAWYLAGRMRPIHEIFASLLRHLPF
ncbi:MAG: YIP1 family protein [Limisphaerales bacterium]